MNRIHGIRYLVLLLCLVLAVSVFVACDQGNKPADTTAGETSGTVSEGSGTSIKVTDYTLIYPENGATEQTAAEALSAAVKEKLGAEFKAVGTDTAMNTAEIDPNALEILVGGTNRSESSAALSDLGGSNGYVVKRAGNKVVINASSADLLDEAVQYFVMNYVAKGESGAFDVPKDLLYVGKASGVSLLDENGKFVYSVIYSGDLDTTSGSDEYDRVDYVVRFILELNKETMLKLGVEEIPFNNDKMSATSDAQEILLGRTNRVETQTFLETLAPNQYGYGVVGNKLVITGWSDYTIAKAIELFISDMENYIVDDGTTKSMVLLPSDTKIETYSAWNVDLPLYNAGELQGVVELLNNSYQAYYTNTTAEEYRAYCESLTANEGFKLYQSNQIGNNLYGTYIDGTTMIHVYYVDYLGAVRFITESMKTAVLPQNTDPYEKITDTTFTTYDFYTASGNWGNCFIITLEDGSFILHDGGSTNSDHDVDELHTLLQRMNKRSDGKIVIAAWIISHQHFDHFHNAYKMVQKYYKDDVTVEKMLFNIPTESVDYNSRNPGSYYENGSFSNIKLWTGADLIFMHSGQTIQIRNLKIEVVYSPDDVYPRGLEKFNNSAFVTRFEVGEGENKQKVMIIGDAEEVACEVMVALHGEALKCDLVTVAHHGWGGSIDLYKYCKPQIVVWPHTKQEANNQLSGGTGYYPTINKSLCNQSNVLLLITSDYGHRSIPLPLIGLTTDRNANMQNFVTVWERADGAKN